MRKTVLFGWLLPLLWSCSLEPSWETLEVGDPDRSPPAVNSSLTIIAERVQQSETGFVFFDEEENELWISAYVTSSDAGGNFYKELYVQDKHQNPKTALRLLLDQQKLYTDFPIGQELYIRLNGLGAGLFRGVLSLGSYQVDGIAPLLSYLIQKHLYKGPQQMEILPTPTQLIEISERDVGLWVSLADVQFDWSEKDNSFAAEAFDLFEGERRLLDCGHHFSIWLSTSTYAAFKSEVLPGKKGRVAGILSRDYYNEKYILKVNSPADMEFNSERCDPYFQESFEAYPLGRFAAEGWENKVVQGSAYWKVFKDQEALGQSVGISAYKTDDEVSEAWLISTPIRVPESGDSYLAFRTSVRRADKSSLSSWICLAHPDPDKREWFPLEAQLATRADDPLHWIDSGTIPLEAYQGESIQVGFQYLGSGKTTYDGTYELDDIRIIENQP